MTMNKKQFVILAALALVLLLAYLGISGYSQWKEENEAVAEAARLQVTELDSDSIVRLSYSNGETEFAFSRNEDSWYYEADGQLPLEQSVVTNALDSYTAVSGTRKLSDADADEDYGLKSPQYVISMEDEAGDITRLKIGSETEDGYYMTADDGESVYTVESSIVDSMIFDEDSLIDYEIFPSIYESSFHKIVVTRGGETLLKYEAEEDDDSDDDDSDEEESLTEIYAGEVGSIYFDDCVDYHAESGELTEYGLDSSSRKEITVTYDDAAEGETETITFYMGDTTEEDGVTYTYTMLADSDMIYRVDATDMTNLLAL